MTSLAFAAASVEPFLHQNVADWWPHHIDQSAWLEHTPFAAWLIPRFKPNLMVELGTHRAVSYMAFCQANAKLDVPGKYCAVDTWEGDEHAGIYSDAVFHGVEKLNDQYREFSTLLRCSFMEASSHFQEASIDLLHIDGLHTYEAVSEDFYTWLPKMSDRGIILFHDIEVKERNFGVWKLWDEVTPKFRHFAFSHGHGLGILAVGHEIPETLKELLMRGNPSSKSNTGERIFMHSAHAYQKTTMLGCGRALVGLFLTRHEAPVGAQGCRAANYFSRVLK